MGKKSKRWFPGALTSAAIVVCGCGQKNFNDPLYTSSVVTCSSAAPPSYTAAAAPIFNSSCVGCHSSYSNYAGVQARAATIQSKVASGEMPKNGSLSAADKDTLIQWAACGAQP